MPYFRTQKTDRRRFSRFKSVLKNHFGIVKFLLPLSVIRRAPLGKINIAQDVVFCKPLILKPYKMSQCKAIKKHPFGCLLFILIFRMFFIVTNYNIITIKPNNRMATALVVQANLGVRISDILKLTLSDIVYDAGRYRLDIIEQKTGKTRNFTVPNGLYDYLVGYAKENHIGEYARLFPVCERALQKQLAIIAEYLNIDGLSTHSFRKFYATEMYQNNDYDIELVRELLQHSSTAVTQKYIDISSKRIEIAINNHLCLA